MRAMTSMDMGKGWAWLRVLFAALLLAALTAGQASAAIVVDSILVNGGSTANVTPGASITVSVTVTLTNGSRWRSTAFTTTPPSTLSTCALFPDINVNGTYTRTFTLTAPTALGVYDLNVAAWTNPNCNGIASTTKKLPGGINTGPVVATLNHVRLTHDGSALTCGVETLTLKACANALCTTPFTSDVAVTLGTAAGTWSSNPVTIVNGAGSVTLTNPVAGNVTLSGTVNSPTAANSSVVCYLGNTANSCTLNFNSNSCSLDAVEPGAAPQTSILTKVYGNVVSLDLLALSGGVINTNSTARIIATLVEDNGSGGCTATALSNTVDITLSGSTSAGRRNVSFTPTRAIRISRVRMTSGSLVGCSSDNFSVRPPSLAVAAGGVVTDAAGTNATLGPVLKAGAGPFSLSAAGGLGYTGVPLIGQGAVQSSGAKAGAIDGSFAAATSANSWTASGSAFTYSEVGYFRLAPYSVYDDAFADVDEAKVPKDCFVDANLGTINTVANPNVAVGGRFGCYFGNTTTSTYYGRFIPDRLQLSDGPMINRSAIPACTAMPAPAEFNYLGEEMKSSFTLTAVNAAGTATENYVGDFARLTVATSLGMGAISDPAAGPRTPYPVCGPTAAAPCITPGTATGAFALGVAPVQAALTVHRGTAPLAPLTEFKVGFAPVDLDGVRIPDAGYDLDTVNVVPAPTANHALGSIAVLRYGRMGIDNAFGSELLPLSMRLNAQYWNGTAYATNTLDNCTQPAFTAFATPLDYKGGIDAANMPFSKLSPGPQLLAGIGKLTLAKPGPVVPTAKGSVTIRSALPYLPGSSRATFGIYKAGPVIHVRETY